MIDAKDALFTFFSEVISSGKLIYETIHNDPAVQTAQPAIGALGVVLGAISGYQIGQVIVLKARGLQHPSLLRPASFLTATVALLVFSTASVAAAIAASTLAAAIFGACRAGFEKQEQRPLNSDLLDKAKPSFETEKPNQAAITSQTANSRLNQHPRGKSSDISAIDLPKTKGTSSNEKKLQSSPHNLSTIDSAVPSKNTEAKTVNTPSKTSAPLKTQTAQEIKTGLNPEIVARARAARAARLAASSPSNACTPVVNTDRPRRVPLPTAEIVVTEESPLGVPIKRKGSGMDKVFYHAEGAKMGFLDTRLEVKDAELKAYLGLAAALSGSGIRVPEVLDNVIKPGPLVEKKSGEIARAEGFWIEFIPNIMNFKPVAAAISDIAAEVGGRNNPIKLYKKFVKEGKIEEAINLKENVKVIMENSQIICPLVGEVTLGINRETGDIYLFDVSPTNGNTAAINANKINDGLKNIYSLMD